MEKWREIVIGVYYYIYIYIGIYLDEPSIHLYKFFIITIMSDIFAVTLLTEEL